jgi:hypothetical protein
VTLDRFEFRPHKALITGITNAQQAVITFDDEHNFVVNELISFRVSKPYGMIELNNLQGKVLSITDTSLRVDIDTLSFSPFVYPPVGQVQFIAMAVPSASGIDEGLYAPAYILNASFDNVPLT